MVNRFVEDRPEKLLNIDHNAKTVKGQKRGYLTGILYLQPHKAFGFNVCPNAEAADCHEVCLNTAGRGVYSQTQDARTRRTRLFHYEREWFMDTLFSDIKALERKAAREGLTPVVRLNGTSDLDWEEIRYRGESPMERFSMIQFYDYTKLPRLPKNRNYHLVFSYADSAKYQRTVRKAERLRMTMAAVFKGNLPETFRGKPVVSGDENDLVFLHSEAVVVGLKAKGRARSLSSDLIAKVAV